MLKGFQSTIPVGQSSHYFSPALANRMLLGERNLTIALLAPRLEFPSATEFKEWNLIFLRALEKLEAENPQHLKVFLKRVTGVPQLRRSTSSQSIRILWVKPSVDYRYLASTCDCSLALALPRGVNATRWIERELRELVSSPLGDTFNTA
jgi:hypothetical protein